MLALSQKGKTIDEIETKRGRKYPGDKVQTAYRDSPVWHNKKDLDEFVATELKLDPSFWGPHKVTSDFLTATTREIVKLRKTGHIQDWNSSKRLSIIWRLTKTSDLPESIPSMSLAGSIPDHATHPTIPETDPERKMREDFFTMIVRGRKDSTYKFALARAMLDHCSTAGAGNIISYRSLAKMFLRYYWHQVCVLKIRQNFHPDKEPKVVTVINEVFGKNTPMNFARLSDNKVQEAENKILKGVFGRLKTSLVVHKFQKIMVGGRAEERRTFYDYSDNKMMICLKPGVFEFFQKNRNILMGLVIREWAKFLERTNESLPLLVAKIENNNTRRNTGVIREFRKLFGDIKHCFYCGNKLEQIRIDVDHLIPWSYIFADNMWNLVLTCRKCNRSKSDSLPQRKFLINLIQRNTQYYDKVGKLKKSLDLLNSGKGWKREIRNHYRLCNEYGFAIKNMPKTVR